MSDKGHVYQIKLDVDNWSYRENVGAVLELTKYAIKGEGEKLIQVYGSQVAKSQLDQLQVETAHTNIRIKVTTRDESKIADYIKQVRLRATEEIAKLKKLVATLEAKLMRDPKVIRKDINKTGVKNDTLTDFEITVDTL